MTIRDKIKAELTIMEVARLNGLPVAEVKASMKDAIKKAQAAASPSWVAAYGSRTPSPAEFLLNLAAAARDPG